MFCTKCGQQVDDNQKFCHKCGAQLYRIQPVIADDDRIEDEDEDDDEYDDDEYDDDVEEEEDYDDSDSDSEINWGKIISVASKWISALVIIWVLVYHNPTFEEQSKEVSKSLKEQVIRNPSHLFTAAYVKRNLKYKNFWVVSWTYVMPNGYSNRGLLGKNPVMCSFGICGLVIPIVEIN